MSEFSFKNHVKIAADSVDCLRRCDVFRLLDNLAVEHHRQEFAEWLTDQRPDLIREVAECLRELR